jgi:hypothetical protein
VVSCVARTGRYVLVCSLTSKIAAKLLRLTARAAPPASISPVRSLHAPYPCQ